MRFKSFLDAVNAAADNGYVKGQTNIRVVTEDGEVDIEHVLVDQDSCLLLVAKGADMIDTPTSKKKVRAASV